MSIGVNLLFYTSYWDEMFRLYDSGEVHEFGLSEDIVEDITKVGNAAYTEAKTFLDDLGGRLLGYVEQGLRFRKKPHRFQGKLSVSKYRWSLEVTLAALNDLERRRCFTIGAGIWQDNRTGLGALAPWVWVKGGRSFLNRLNELLKVGVVEDGILRLDYIPMPPFDADRYIQVEPLYEKLVETYQPLFAVLPEAWKLATQAT